MNHSITRSIVFWILFIGVLYAVSFIGYLFPSGWSRPINGILGMLSAFGITWLFCKTEKKPVKEIGLVWERETIARFFKGLLLGTVIFLLILAILVRFTELQLQRNP